MTTRRRWHQSEVQTFLKCGKQWEFRYVMGIKTPPKAALTVGSAVDVGVSKNFVQKIQTGLDLPLEAVLDTYSTDFDSRAKETEWGKYDAGEQKDMGAELVKIHHAEAAPNIQPATVQESFVIETDAGYDLGGTIDLVEKSGVIVDTKTSKDAYNELDLSGLQPALYDFAYEALHKKPSAGFRFDVLKKPTKTKPGAYLPVSGLVPPNARIDAFDTISQVHRAAEAGIAMPAPEGAWWCSPDWCGYWSRCKGRK